jgi:hypothetical protein
MLIHSVFFWLTDETRSDGTEAFERALRELAKLDLIQAAYVGIPAGTAPRPVTDHSFDYSLILHFENLADHDTYQNHPAHLAFVEQNKDKWSTVKVRDSEVIADGEKEEF